MGIASQIITTRKKKAYRILPVMSAIKPTIKGPKKELDCKTYQHRARYGEGTRTLSVIENKPYLTRNKLGVVTEVNAKRRHTILPLLQEAKAPHRKPGHTLEMRHKQTLGQPFNKYIKRIKTSLLTEIDS